jgi:hypothetical protein
MNRQQRMQNRFNARMLENNSVICPECGERGKHFVVMQGLTLQGIINGLDDSTGFWTCAKFYGEDGRRLEP